MKKFLTSTAFILLLTGCTDLVYLRERTESQERQISQLRSELERTKQEYSQTLSEREREQLALREQVEQMTRQQIVGQQPAESAAPVSPGQAIMGQPMAAPTPEPAAPMPSQVPQPPAFSPSTESPQPTAAPAAAAPVGQDSLRQQLESVFEQAIAQKQITVESGANGVNVTLWSNMVFSQGANLAPYIGQYLRAVGDVAAANSSTEMTVVAYAGGDNGLALAAEQASAVAGLIQRESNFNRQPVAVGRTADPGSGNEKIVIELRAR